MSQAAIVQCLFCHHFNSSDANFCNSCDGQLNLRPCDRCGAVDDRTATNCHKCGGEFALPSATGLNSSSTFSVIEDKATHFAPLRFDDVEPSPEAPSTSRERSRGSPIAVSVIFLFLVGTAASVYLYRANTESLAAPQNAEQVVVDMTGDSVTVETAPSNNAIQTNAGFKPLDKPQKPSVDANNAGSSPALLPSRSDAAAAPLPLPLPLPANDADQTTLQSVSETEKCPAAIVTLGLCDEHIKKENP